MLCQWPRESWQRKLTDHSACRCIQPDIDHTSVIHHGQGNTSQKICIPHTITSSFQINKQPVISLRMSHHTRRQYVVKMTVCQVPAEEKRIQAWADRAPPSPNDEKYRGWSWLQEAVCLTFGPSIVWRWTEGFPLQEWRSPPELCYRLTL